MECANLAVDLDWTAFAVQISADVEMWLLLVGTNNVAPQEVLQLYPLPA